MVERFFFQRFTEAEGSCYPNLPSKKGIGFSEEHAQLIGERVYSTSQILGVPPVASDVKGWEKNFTEELAEDHSALMQVTALDFEECKDTISKVCKWWSTSLVSTPYVLDSGELLDFDNDRVQRSGDFLTTSSNGTGRGIAGEAAGSVVCTMGDDCLEWTELDTKDLIQRYKELGVPVRDVEVQREDSFLFCSHRFQRGLQGDWKCWLETWERMLYEASFSRRDDDSTIANYVSEIEQMPPCEDKVRILEFLKLRQVLLSALPQHEKYEDSDEDPDTGQ